MDEPGDPRANPVAWARLLMHGDGALVRWGVPALVLLAFGLRVYHLDYQSLWRDEVDALIFATRDLGLVLGNFTKIGENGPLYFLLLRFWIVVTGSSEFSLRFFSLLFGTLTVPLAYAVGRWLLSRQVGLFGALITAVSPYYVWYAQEAKMYALLTFLSLLSVLLYLLALDRRRRWLWAAFVAVTSLSLYVHVFAALVVVLEALLFVTGLVRRQGSVRAWAIVFGLLTLPYLPLAVWQWPTLLSPPAPSYPFLDPGSILSVLVFAWSLSVGRAPEQYVLVFFIFLLLAGLLLYPTGRERSGMHDAETRGEDGKVPRRAWGQRRGVLILAAYLLVPVLGFYLVSLRLPLFTDRYLIIVTPAYYLLLACGLVAVARRSVGYVAMCSAVVLGVSTYSLWSQSHTKIKADFKSAAKYYAEHSTGGEPVMFVMPYVERVFAYYHPRPLPVRAAPYTNGGLSAEQVDASLRQELRDRRDVWLFLSEQDLYDSRGLVKDWLDHHARLIESGTYARVALYRYRMSDSQTRRASLPLLGVP